MSTLVIKETDIKLNKLEYNTFDIEIDESSGVDVAESRNVSISTKLGTSVSNENDHTILFDIFIQGTYEEYILREFYLDIFYNFEVIKNEDNLDRETIGKYMVQHFQKKINTIISSTTSIDNNYVLDINESIDRLEKKLNELNISVDIKLIS